MKPIVYNEAPISKAELVAQRLEKYGTFGQVANNCDNLTGEEPAQVTTQTAAEMMQAELALMKGLGM